MALRSAAKLGTFARGRPCLSTLMGRPCGTAARATAPRLQTIFSRALASESLASDVHDVLKVLEGTIGPLSTAPMVPPPQPRVVVISGPSGVGKDAVIKRLQELRPDLYFVVTATSRPMRPGEVEGKDYFFVSKEQFEAWIAADLLLEHALVYGEYKGIPRQQVDQALAKGTDVVLRIDVQGAETVRKLMPSAITIFLVAETEVELVTRLVSRKTEPLDRMLVRVATAREEVARLTEFDYVVVNRDGRLDECVAHIGAIIDAEKRRVQH